MKQQFDGVTVSGDIAVGPHDPIRLIIAQRYFTSKCLPSCSVCGHEYEDVDDFLLQDPVKAEVGVCCKKCFKPRPTTGADKGGD